MSYKKIKTIFLSVAFIYFLFVVLFYFLAGDQLRYKDSLNNIEVPEADSVTRELTDGTEIIQEFVSTVDNIEEVALVFTKFYRDGVGSIKIEVYDDEEVYIRRLLRVESIPEQHRVYLYPEEPIMNVRGKKLTIRLTSNSRPGKGAAVMMRQNGVAKTSYITVGKLRINGTLCFSIKGTDMIYASDYYWYIMGTIGVLLCAILFVSYSQYKKGRINYIVSALNAVERYRFLISQLVTRDFKSKYKRSILGVFWSFLNPLLTMTVQFLVFSTFFSSDTKNYPIYLLSGVVCFSFFNECTTMCLSSISGNARLITKVYIPKYIFPLARTISSSINLAISLVPLFLACPVLGVTLKPQVILFFYFLICLIIFSLGIGLFLSALMVFFRDIQFLWTVLTQIWMYATPIFYPAEIIPEKYRFVVRLNPLYHFIGNARICLINGISPSPNAYIYCLLFALVSLLIGSYTFKKTQDRFALYL